MASAFLMVALAALARLAAAVAGGASLVSGMGDRPVMKVVRLLQDMKAELEHELADDKAVHETISCWCKANDKEKTGAIAAGEAKVAQLEASLSEDAAQVRDLKEKRKVTLAEVNSDIAAKEQASTIRLKEKSAFHAEEVDLVEAVKACQQAIVVLSKHHPSLAQVSSIVRRLRDARIPQLALSAGLLAADKLEALRSFVQQGQTAPSFLSIPGYQSYAPQSGQIFGILQTMKENFEAHLSEEQEAELKAEAAHKDLMASKKEEIASGKKMVRQLDEDIAALGEKAAQESQDLEDTNNQLVLDRTFLADVKAKCSETDGEFDARVKSRMAEIAAVDDTITILNADDAFNNFGTTVDRVRKVQEVDAVGFLQVSAAAEAREQRFRQRRAASALRSAAQRLGASQLAAVAASAQLDAFTKVKEMVDKLVDELTKQQSDEVEQRDWCVAEFAGNARETSAADDKKSGLQTKIADLEKSIESLTKEIGDTQAGIDETQESMKRASETREAENAAFQRTISDQRLTQSILLKAVGRMKEVYAFLQRESDADASATEDESDQPGAAHIATSGNHTNAGNSPARFTKYEQSAGGKRVVKLLEEIIADSKNMEEEALKSEEDSQTAYENLMKDSNKLIASSTAAITNLSEARATAKSSLSMAKADLKQTLEGLEGLNVYLGDLHRSCDFLMNNFDARQAARAAEVDALNEAKAILSGMK
eukprot:CAMPEP_0117498054 /NCGR_PEP_ID=MMETSP0784-20121206/21510_1 /TAXON_ID=39447 /ORGANISM="" /LENGTH=710 /DNA_ID=CAMNT_0005293115 /DNA_START=71 /DNA_END=2203 /DNA_ORIENTATION=-